MFGGLAEPPADKFGKKIITKIEIVHQNSVPGLSYIKYNCICLRSLEELFTHFKK